MPLSLDEIDELWERLNVGQTSSRQECESISSGGISLGVPGVIAVVSAQLCDACARLATDQAATYHLRSLLEVGKTEELRWRAVLDVTADLAVGGR